jgi:ferritin-like metal-binding protein YciE
MAAKMKTLEDLYVDMLKDLYSAEKQLVKALPKMVKNTQNAELQRAFQDHLKQTEGHVDRLERIFSELGSSPRGKKCVGMEGLVAEGYELLQEDAEPDVLDAGLSAAAQKVEHYEIASYGTVRTWAERLGYQNAAKILQETLDEEGEANKKLTQIAESVVNMEAQS